MTGTGDRHLTRRSFLAAGVALGAGIVLAGCGGDDLGAAGSTTGTAPAGGFPLTMRHIYGETTIPAVPQRVVTAGFNDADFALAVGVVPVGVADFIGEYPEESRAWAQEALGGVQPEKVTNAEGEIRFEKVVGLRPDLIVYYNWLEEADYERLSTIAPTVVEPEPGSLWPAHTVDVGRALGREDEARALVASVQDRFATARAAHPEFEGATATLLFGIGAQDSEYWVLPPDDPRTGVFTSLGFRMPDETGAISKEEASKLESDVIVVIGTPQDVLEADTLLQRLETVRDGRLVDLGGFEDEFAGAMGWDSPLSLPVAIDLAVPPLAEALARR